MARSNREARILSLIDKTDNCWLWTGATTRGYGRFGKVQAHREVWNILRGHLPKDMHLHHECGVRLCVNPDHLTPMTNAAHHAIHDELLSHCKYGHPFDVENTYTPPNRPNQRHCRECHRRRLRDRYRRLGY